MTPRNPFSRLGPTFARLLRPDLQVRTLAGNSSWVFTANAAKTVLAFVKSIVIARGLGLDLFGTYVVAAAAAAAVQEILNPNFYSVVVKFGADYVNAGRVDQLVALAKGAVWVGGGLAMLSVTVVWLAVELVPAFQGEALAAFVLLCAVAGIGNFVNPAASGLLRLYFRFKVSALVAIAVGVIDLAVIAAVLALAPGDLWAFVTAVVVISVVSTVVLNGAAAWELRHELGPHRRAALALIAGERRAITHFVLHNSGSRTLKVMMDRGDVLLLGVLAGTSQVGLYEIAKKLGYTVLRLTDPLSASVFPQVASLIAGRRLREVRGLLARTSAGLAGLSVVGGIVGLALGAWAIVQMYGAEFAGAAAPFTLHLMTALASAVLFWTLPVTLALGKVQERLYVMGAALVLGAGLGLALTPPLGAVGMAAASFISKTAVLVALALLSWAALRAPSAVPSPSV